MRIALLSACFLFLGASFAAGADVEIIRKDCYDMDRSTYVEVRCDGKVMNKGNTDLKNVQISFIIPEDARKNPGYAGIDASSFTPWVIDYLPAKDAAFFSVYWRFSGRYSKDTIERVEIVTESILDNTLTTAISYELDSE